MDTSVDNKKTNQGLNLKRALILLGSCILLSACGSDSNDQSNQDANQTINQPNFDFSAIDTSLQTLVNESSSLEGISAIFVDAELGVVHQVAIGDHTLETTVLLASTSKVPSASLLMAMHDDETINYDVEASIDSYLPWSGVYGDRTSVQLVSNTSGIPGLAFIDSYGDHNCQFSPLVTMEECGQILYGQELPGTQPAGSGFSYGGSQWQLAGSVVEQVTADSWQNTFDSYIGEPCGLEVFQYGNPWSDLTQWTGDSESLIGKSHAHVEGGAISNLQDYAKILLLHLNNGKCDETQVLSSEAVTLMQTPQATDIPQGPTTVSYGMGWWIVPNEDDSPATIFYDPGLFGAISWIDTDRKIGGYVAVDYYPDPSLGDTTAGTVTGLVRSEIMSLFATAIDAGKAAVE